MFLHSRLRSLAHFLPGMHSRHKTAIRCHAHFKPNGTKLSFGAITCPANTADLNNDQFCVPV